MDSLVVSNVQQRPTRTAVSILGVALGVVLVLIFVGLVNGMQHSRAQRDSNVGADIMFCREFSLTTTSLSLPTQYRDWEKHQPRPLVPHKTYPFQRGKLLRLLIPNELTHSN